MRYFFPQRKCENGLQMNKNCLLFENPPKDMIDMMYVTKNYI